MYPHQGVIPHQGGDSDAVDNIKGGIFVTTLGYYTNDNPFLSIFNFLDAKAAHKPP